MSSASWKVFAFPFGYPRASRPPAAKACQATDRHPRHARRKPDELELAHVGPGRHLTPLEGLEVASGNEIRPLLRDLLRRARRLLARRVASHIPLAEVTHVSLHGSYTEAIGGSVLNSLKVPWCFREMVNDGLMRIGVRRRYRGEGQFIFADMLPVG